MGEPRRLAVLGHPAGHSLSPAMHNAAFEALGLAAQWRYEAIDVAPEDFAERVRGMEGEGFAGANVTIPHKLAALELADESSAAAREIGAANTLSFAGGRIRADNTDAEGLLSALPDPPEGRRALVMGAGGAGRAVVWALAGQGAEVAVWNRTHEKAERLAAELGSSAVSTGEIDQEAFDLIVNATSVGLDPSSGVAKTRPEAGRTLAPLPISADKLHTEQTLVDLVYRVGGTALTNAARERGAKVVDGLEILVSQGVASFRIWTGLEPPIEAMRNAISATDTQ